MNYTSETVNEGKRLLALADEEFFQLEIERAEQMGVVLLTLLIINRILVVWLIVRLSYVICCCIRMKRNTVLHDFLH